MAAPVSIPGEPTKTGTALTNTAASAVQSFAPINQIHQHLCAKLLFFFSFISNVFKRVRSMKSYRCFCRFHIYGEDMTRQVEVHHFCSHQNEDMRQCLVYDSPEANARLIGVEYLISENLFLTLPDGEKPLWHSHEYEVKSGILFLPGVPGPVQRQGLEKVSKTYGKTFHFWQVDRGDELPLGLPQIMLALTRDGQLNTNLAQEKKFEVSFETERENRAYMIGPENGIHPLANGGGKGLKTAQRDRIASQWALFLRFLFKQEH